MKKKHKLAKMYLVDMIEQEGETKKRLRGWKIRFMIDAHTYITVEPLRGMIRITSCGLSSEKIHIVPESTRAFTISHRD